MKKTEKIIADFGFNSKNTAENKFGRTMSEMLHLMEYHHGATKVDDLTLDELFEGELEDITDNDEFYAGPETVKFIFKHLPKKFIIENNIDGNPESFLITKTEENTFSAKLIN